MRVDSSRSEVAAALERMASIILANGGVIAEDFTVRESNGHFSATIGEREPGRVLLSYPLTLRPQMANLPWDNSPDELTLAGSVRELTVPQAALVETWLALINVTSKVSWTRGAVPMFAVANWSLRHHLADGGYPVLRNQPTLAALREAVVGWHSSGGGRPAMRASGNGESSEAGGHADPKREQGNPSNRAWWLIPLKCFVNHHPEGANQDPVPGRVAVAAANPTHTEETFENYGDLDAMQLLMNFGYLDDAAPLVHSVPVEVESQRLGRVVVRWRAPRNPRTEALARDAPSVTPTETGLELRHLTARPDNRERIVGFLAMAARAQAGLTSEGARKEAEAAVDAIAQANLNYYRRLDELVVEAQTNPAEPLSEGFGTQEILPTIAAMSLRQQQRLNSMWGRY